MYSFIMESHNENDVYVLLHFVFNATIPTYQAFTACI